MSTPPHRPSSGRRALSERRRARQQAIRRRRLGALAAVALLAAIFAIVASGAGSSRNAGRNASASGSGGSGHGKSSAHHRSKPLVAGPNLAPGSNPNVLPGPILIADRNNNRLLEISPTGEILWQFPGKQGLPPGMSFIRPDDAFFAPNGKEIVATQEEDSAISVINVAEGKIVYRYGHPGVPGSEPGYLHNPDDAMMMPNGEIFAADIMNCRLIEIMPPAHTLLRQFGTTGECVHNPPTSYGSPNGAFPMANGDTVVTEINGDFMDIMNSAGQTISVTNPPGYEYPSDTNQVRPGVFLSADYVSPGAIETFTETGKLLWRFEPHGGPEELSNPSLALPLPNGDILANDDYNDRVIVIDPKTNKIVWQYGHRGVAGTAPGYLNNPDGVDLAPPYSLTMRFAKTLKAPE